MALAVAVSAGCAPIRQYNGPEDELKTAVETTHVGRPLRVGLSSGQTVEGTLISHNWPDMVLMVNGSKDSLDARQVTAIWRSGVSKRKGQLVGAAIGSVPLTYLFGYPSIPGAVLGGMLGAALGTLMSSGSPEWQRTYP